MRFREGQCKALRQQGFRVVPVPADLYHPNDPWALEGAFLVAGAVFLAVSRMYDASQVFGCSHRRPFSLLLRLGCEELGDFSPPATMQLARC